MMLERKAMPQLEAWKDAPSRGALLVTGARQVGKTYIIREFGRRHYRHVVEINLLEIEGAAAAFNSASDSTDLLSRITLYANDQLVPHETLIFIDEVQESPEMITAAKFLVDKTGADYDYVFSGSLLGVELKGIRSWPVGYLREIRMFPLDFEEFCWANGLSKTVLGELREAAVRRRAVDTFLHRKVLDLFYYYLAVGGMPKPVASYLRTHDLQQVRASQQDILEAYRHDITQYRKDRALLVKAIFDNIPSQLNQQNKRYIVSSIDKNARASRIENDFLWLAEANVALPVYNVEEPRYPLQLSANSTLFKLFMNDVGLLAGASGMETIRKTLLREPTNYGAIYENFVAQELFAHGFKLYYFRNKKMGELDFVIERPQGEVVPLEVKSGKDYHRHRAISRVLDTRDFGLEEALVLCDANVHTEEKVVYLPIYMAGFL